MPTVVTILVGAIGSGKTTWLGWKAAENHQVRPNYPSVANIPIKFLEGDCLNHKEGGICKHIDGCKCPSVHYEEDILKFIAMKLIKRDLTPMDMYVDEAAQAGFESRGSGLSGTDSRLVTLARKTNGHLFLASQLLSMVDKRAQWNGDFYEDCSSHYVTVENMERFIPDYFQYEVYDGENHHLKTWYMFQEDFEPYVFPLFDTMQIPLRTLLEAEFKMYYWRGEHKGEFDEEAFKNDERRFEEFIATIKSRQSRIKAG